MNTELKVVLGFLTGAALGSAAGLLLAPKSGRETREMLNEELNTLKKDLESAAADKLKESRKTYNETVKDLTKKGKTTLEDLKSAVSFDS